MNRFRKETLKSRILRLAGLKGTGTPAELAIKLEISERSVKRIIKEIRDEGICIRYNIKRESYVIDEKK
jgi:DNA-binding Lrp family transcriptional regulator